MTNQEIENLKAGREIDRIIADYFWSACLQYPLDFSTDIGCSFLLVNKLNSRGFKVHISIDQNGDCESVSIEAGDSNCHHKKNYDPADGHGYTCVDYSPIQSIKPPLAICHAALKLIDEIHETKKP